MPFERDERDAAAVFLQKKAQAPLDLNGKIKARVRRHAAVRVAALHPKPT